MPASTYNLYIEQGASFLCTFKFLDSLGAPRDFTGWTFLATLAKDTKPTTVKTFDFTVANPEPGVLTLSADAVQTGAIPTVGATASEVSVYVYTLEGTVGTIVERLLQGTVKVSPEASRG